MHFFQKLLPLLFPALLLCATEQSAFAQIEDPERTFRDLTRLEGTWFMGTDRGDRLEIWTYVNDSTMTGIGCRIKPENNDTVVLERLRLERRDTVITYHAIVRGQNDGKSVPFVLTEASYDEYVFENPKHDDPKKIRYFLLERRELQVTTEGVRNGRPTKQEFVFEREFNPASIGFNARFGLNMANLYKTNQIGIEPAPTFSPRPGWELGVSASFQGSGGFLSVNVDLGLMGKFPHVESAFSVYDPTDTLADQNGNVNYRRNLTYNQTWFTAAVTPEVKLKRSGKTSILFGAYFARLIINRTKGTEEPIRNRKVYNFNNDFKKTDFGAIVGLQRRQNFGKKDLGGTLGIRAQIGLTNLDNLYNKGKGIYNGRVSLSSIALTYSIDLLKI